MSAFKSAVAQRFDRSSSTYDDNALLQASMGGQIMERLRRHDVPVGSILELGCGTGGLTAGLLDTFPGAQVGALDIAPAMVAYVCNRLADEPRLTVHLADAEATAWPPDSFDLIVSNAAVQWFEHPHKSICTLSEALRPGGLSAHSTFGPGTFADLFGVLGEIEAERETPPAGYGLPLLSAGQWRGALEVCGLENVQVSSQTVRRHYAGLLAFLKALKGTGATLSQGRPASPAGYSVLKELIRRYDAEYSNSDGVAVTYEILLMEGRKPG
ncbi:MAG: methyltransferase domain-containing protein [Actinomycetota bacterium]